jgi:hypothetical protein
MLQSSTKWEETMRRREFITLVGGAAAAWPLTAFGKTPRIAIVAPSVPVTVMTETGDDPRFSALLKELRRLGYVEGQNHADDPNEFRPRRRQEGMAADNGRIGVGDL